MAISFMVVGYAVDGPSGLRGVARQRCDLIDNVHRGTSVHYNDDCD